MLYRSLGQSGIEASAVAFGAWAIGGWLWGGTNEADAVDAIHAALAHGINLIDTAPIYGLGKSEELAGKAIRKCRDEVLIATKCGMKWDGEPIGDLHAEVPIPGSQKPRRIYINLRPESIRAELDASLRRLGTDYVDLYQTHWQDSTTPIAETMGCLMDLRAEGKIRAIGVSNASPEQIDAYRALGPVHVDQERYSMLDRELETANLDYCRRHGMAFMAYSPLAHGLLTGKVDAGRKFAEGDFRRDSDRFTPESIQRIRELLDILGDIAAQSGLTVAQLVIRWTLQQPGCTHALCGARNAEQARENAIAGDGTLDDQALAAISEALAGISEGE